MGRNWQSISYCAHYVLMFCRICREMRVKRTLKIDINLPIVTKMSMCTRHVSIFQVTQIVKSLFTCPSFGDCIIIQVTHGRGNRRLLCERQHCRDARCVQSYRIIVQIAFDKRKYITNASSVFVTLREERSRKIWWRVNSKSWCNKKICAQKKD